MRQYRTGEEQRARETTCKRILAEHQITGAVAFELYLMGTGFRQLDRLSARDLTPLRILSTGCQILTDPDHDDCVIELYDPAGAQFWFPLDGGIVERLLERQLLQKVRTSPTNPRYIYYQGVGITKTRIRKFERRLAREERIGWDKVPDIF